jgi:hypothetical protein
LQGTIVGEGSVLAAANNASEQQVAIRIKELLSSHFPGHAVDSGKSILYKIEIDAFGKVTHDAVDAPSRGQFAFQTDILITKASLPLVVIELKVGSFSTHDVITYSWKAVRHKQVYPYLRYGFVVFGLGILGRRFVTHNEGFDFAMALPDMAAVEGDLVPLVQRQLASAERMRALIGSSRVKLRRYEETVEIDQ